MRNLRIGTRLLLGFTLIVALTVGLGLYAIYEQTRVREFSSHMDTRDFRVVDAIQQLENNESQMRATREMALLNAALARERLGVEDGSVQEAAWRTSRDRNMKLLEELQADTVQWEQDSLTAERAAQWRAIRSNAAAAEQALRELSPRVEAMFARLDARDLAGAVRVFPEIENLRNSYEAKLAACQR
jgi:hypothetical protein